MIYELGPSELGKEPEGAIWTVAHYTEQEYDGKGESVSLMPDGTLLIHDLGHCSCYGPLEESGDTVSVADYLESASSVHGYVTNHAVDAKVRELLKAGGA